MLEVSTPSPASAALESTAASPTLSTTGLPAKKDSLEVSEEGRKERGMNKAALSIAELEALLVPPLPPVASSPEVSATEAPIPLSSINHVARYLPTLQASKEALIAEMETMVFDGLSGLVSALRPLFAAESDTNIVAEPIHPRIFPSDGFQPCSPSQSRPDSPLRPHRRRRLPHPKDLRHLNPRARCWHQGRASLAVRVSAFGRRGVRQA